MFNGSVGNNIQEEEEQEDGREQEQEQEGKKSVAEEKYEKLGRGGKEGDGRE